MIARRRVHVATKEYETFLNAFTEKNVDTGTIENFEKDLAKFVGVEHAVAVSSGRQAMSLILRGLGLSAGDEVIVPAYTLGALLNLVESTGATIVLADIDEETLTVTAKTLSQRITEKTRAIIVLHIFGNPCDMIEIMKLAEDRSVAVIEDCAHSLGATFQGKQTGSFGRAAFISFETTKPLNTFGGGAVLTNDKELVNSIRQQLTHFESDGRQAVLQKARAIERENWMFSTGLAYFPLLLLSLRSTRNLVEMAYRFFQPPQPRSIPYLPQQAKLGLSGLNTLPERIKHRDKMANLYDELLNKDISHQLTLPMAISTWYFYVAILPKAAFSVRRKLLYGKIDCAVEKEIADDCTLLRPTYDCPVTNDVYERAIVLPMYDDITEDEVAIVAKALNETL